MKRSAVVFLAAAAACAEARPTPDPSIGQAIEEDRAADRRRSTEASLAEQEKIDRCYDDMDSAAVILARPVRDGDISDQQERDRSVLITRQCERLLAAEKDREDRMVQAQRDDRAQRAEDRAIEYCRRPCDAEYRRCVGGRSRRIRRSMGLLGSCDPARDACVAACHPR